MPNCAKCDSELSDRYVRVMSPVDPPESPPECVFCRQYVVGVHDRFSESQPNPRKDKHGRVRRGDVADMPGYGEGGYGENAETDGDGEKGVWANLKGKS